MTERDFVEFFSAQSPDVQSRLRSAFLVPPDVDEMRELRNRVRNLEATLCDITNAAKRALT
jgi:hypothetical protein